MSVDFLTAAKIWWSWMWRVVVWSLALGVGAGFLMGIVAAIMGVDKEIASGLFAIVGGLIGIPISIWCLQTALNKYF